MSIPLYGQESNSQGAGLDNKVGPVIRCTGAAAVTLTASQSGALIVIAGGANGAAAVNLPSCKGLNGLEYTFILQAANGTGDFDIDAKDGAEYFLGPLACNEAADSTFTAFNGSSHDQLTLVASKGAPGDMIKLRSLDGKWLIAGSIVNDMDGWVVGTASANT